MADPIWLNHERIDFIHEQAIDMAGGSRGLRDPGLLDSELARPKNLHAYGEQDIFQLTASYAEAISQNHPFVDGNKRVAFGAAARSLRINGHELEAAKDDEHAT